MILRLKSILFVFICFASTAIVNANTIYTFGDDEITTRVPNFSITPNPVNGSYFNVNLSFSDSEFPDAGIIISDVLGKVVYTYGLKQSDFMEGKIKVSVMDANLDKGVYFLQIKSGENTKTLKLAIR